MKNKFEPELYMKGKGNVIDSRPGSIMYHSVTSEANHGASQQFTSAHLFVKHCVNVTQRTQRGTCVTLKPFLPMAPVPNAAASSCCFGTMMNGTKPSHPADAGIYGKVVCKSHA